MSEYYHTNPEAVEYSKHISQMNWIEEAQFHSRPKYSQITVDNKTYSNLLKIESPAVIQVNNSYNTNGVVLYNPPINKVLNYYNDLHYRKKYKDEELIKLRDYNRQKISEIADKDSEQQEEEATLLVTLGTYEAFVDIKKDYFLKPAGNLYAGSFFADDKTIMRYLVNYYMDNNPEYQKINKNK